MDTKSATPETVDDARRRELRKLRADLGPLVLGALDDRKTVEVVLNPDGRLWQERLGEPMREIGTMPAWQAEAVIRTVAAILKTTVTRENAILDGELPDGSRFSGQIPPVVSSPVFAIRKRASAVFPLPRYVEQGIMTEAQKEVLSAGVRDHRNIVVSGPVGSGKTTLLNALVREIDPSERILIIEDTTELQCSAPNSVQYRTSETADMTRLVRATLRMRPDRVLIGEVRGPEALDFLIACNLGHPGGMATVHANDARSSLMRLETLVSMHSKAPRDIPRLIGEAQLLLIHITRTKGGRVLREILDVQGYGPDDYHLQPLS
jgi:type IV secretion system protein TrbB